jgi:HD-like signal output (HDOD) protein
MFDWFLRIFSDPKQAAPAPPERQPADGAPPARTRRFASDSVSTMQRDRVDFMFASWLFEAEERSEIFTNPTEDAILVALDEVVKSDRAGAHLVRRMPGVIPQLLQSLRNPDFSGAEVSRNISHDLVLVAEVLRLANSVGYSHGKSITGVDHAVLVLGQNGLRQLVTSVAFKPIINLHSGSFTRRLAPRLWSQSERCAIASHVLAQGSTVGSAVDPLDAFLAGLIQNIGLTVSLRVIDKMTEGRQPVGSPTFCNALASHGRTLACNISREWHFPDAVTTAIGEQGTSDRPSQLSAVGRILSMGDYLSKIDILIRHGRIDADDPEVLDGLSEKELACLKELSELEERDWVALASTGPRA